MDSAPAAIRFAGTYDLGIRLPSDHANRNLVTVMPPVPKGHNPTPTVIRELRALRGWSHDELADRLGIHGSGSLVSDWEEGKRSLEAPLANLVLATLQFDARSALEEKAETIWRREGNWREAWRQVSALPIEPTKIEASAFSTLFPEAALPASEYAHGFPFVDYNLPKEVYALDFETWTGVIPAKDHPPAYLWLLEREGGFLYREKIWEDQKSSITGGHIHVGSLLEIAGATVFFLRRLARRASLSPRYQLAIELSGMKGRGVVAQRENLPSDMLLVDSPDREAETDRRRAAIDVDLAEIESWPLAVTYRLIAELLLTLRPDLANPVRLERHLRLRHASDDRRGGTRFLGFLDDVFNGKPPRRAVVSLKGRRIGLLVETPSGTRFTYDKNYASRPDARALSPKLPVRIEPYEATGLLPFFDNLLPEGDQLAILVRQRKLDERDKFGLLLATLPTSVGDVQVHQEEKVETP